MSDDMIYLRSVKDWPFVDGMLWSTGIVVLLTLIVLGRPHLCGLPLLPALVHELHSRIYCRIVGKQVADVTAWITSVFGPPLGPPATIEGKYILWEIDGGRLSTTVALEKFSDGPVIFFGNDWRAKNMMWLHSPLQIPFGILAKPQQELERAIDRFFTACGEAP